MCVEELISKLNKIPDEDEDIDEGEGKDEVALDWQSETHIAESAGGINAIEN